MQNIGFIGLGKMGIPMAQNLIKSGYTLKVFNRDQTKAKTLSDEGATIAENPSEITSNCDLIILMVSDDEATRSILTGQEGLLSAEIEHRIIINMSTVSPSISREMAQLAESKNAIYLDAPVSGSLKQAQEGSLVIMVGGNADAFEQVKPILESMGKLAIRVGDSGAGNNAKLAINALLSVHALGLSETIAFAKQNGIDTSQLLELINNSALGNVFMKIKGEAILQNNFNPVFALKHIVKDLNLAKDQGLTSPLAVAATATFQNAQKTVGEEDIIAIYKKLSDVM